MTMTRLNVLDVGWQNPLLRIVIGNWIYWSYTDEKANSIPPQEAENAEEEKDEENQGENNSETARSQHSGINEDEKATHTSTRAVSAIPILAYTCSTLPYMSVEEYQVCRFS